SNYFGAGDGLKINYAKMSHLGQLNENTLWNEGTLPVFSTKIIALRNGIFIVNGGSIGIFTTDIQESHLNDYKGIFPFNRSKLFTGYYGIRFTMKPEENSSQKDIKPVIIDSLILPVVSAVTSASSLIASDSATFTAAAQNTTAYQWQKMVAEQWTDIEGETETTYTAEFTGTDEGTYYYRCVALNGILKAYSNVLTLIVIVVPKPIVSIISSASSLIAPDSATFTAAAQNTTAYQWQKMVAEQWTDIEGATGTTLTESFTITDTGTKYYRCKVTGKGGTAYSETITLTVSLPPAPIVMISGVTVDLSTVEDTREVPAEPS
ncbi:MAG: hypothetical protein O0X49_06520, partial [Methanocorpusculum sp.]|nr:hypothetical protein [Methanocorpusculum sp.]